MVRSFSARLIWGSSTTRCPTSVASFFIQFNNSLLVYHIRRDTLRYFAKSSIILDIHFWCITFAVMHHHILPCRHTRVNSTSWDSLVCGPASITTFWFPADTRCLKTHPLIYRLIRWAPQKIEFMLPPARLLRALSEKPKTSSLTAQRADRLAQGFYQYNLTTTTTPTVVDS